MYKAIDFVSNHPGAEVTMVGHSKGGFEAIMNALVTNTNCITFNALSPFNNNSVIGRAAMAAFLAPTYTKHMTHYVVSGEPVYAANIALGSTFFENSGKSTLIFLETQHTASLWWMLLGPEAYAIAGAGAAVANHGMESVVTALGGTPLVPKKPMPKPSPTPNYTFPWVEPGAPKPGAIVGW